MKRYKAYILYILLVVAGAMLASCQGESSFQKKHKKIRSCLQRVRTELDSVSKHYGNLKQHRVYLLQGDSLTHDDSVVLEKIYSDMRVVDVAYERLGHVLDSLSEEAADL